MLTSILAGSMRTVPKPLPAGTSRAEIIRHLSVFVSHLDTIFRPDNANYAMTSQASFTITRVLDEVLEPSSQPTASQQTTSHSEMKYPLTPSHSNSGPPTTRTTGVAESISNGIGVNTRLEISPDPFMGSFDEQGFNDWMSSIDWTAAGGEWSHL